MGGPHNDLPVKIKLLITLWWISNQETYRQVADRFNMTRGKIYKLFLS
jgi:hypothetical protein